MNCDCLKGTVQLRALCEARTDCTVYLDDMPNISYEAFANWTTAEKQAVADVFGSIEAAAISSLTFKLKTAIQRKLGKARKDRNIQSGFFLAPAVEVPIADQFCGIRIPTEMSEATEVRIRSVRIYSATPVTTAVYIYDLGTHTLLDSFPIDNQSGYITVPIETTYQSERGILIAYDRRVVASQKTRSTSCGCGNASCYTCQAQQLCSNRCFCVEVPADFDPTTTDLPLTGSCGCDTDECGLEANYSIRCNSEHLICQVRDQAAFMLRIEMARLFFEDQRIGKAVNAFTLITPDDRGAILDMLKDEWEQYLPGFLEAIDADGFCFECKGTRHVIALP